MTSFKLRTSEKTILLLVLTVVAYIPALQAGYIWDDPYHVTENPLLHTPLGLWRIWFEIGSQRQYYPLTLSVFWINFHLWGLEPFFYHLQNVLLHGVNAILVWKLCRRLRLPAPWLAGAIFALHPVMVESVAWVTELKNVLSGFFYLLSAHAMFSFFRLDGQDSDRAEGIDAGNAHPWKQWALGLFFFACALCSKSVTATLPAALLVIIWWRTGRLQKKQLYALLPFFALGITYGLLTATMEQDLGASGPLWDFSFFDRCLIAGRALWFYLGKLAWPADILFNYQRWAIDDTNPLQYVYPCGFILLLAGAWAMRKKIGRGLLAALLFFAGTLFPALGFLNVYPMQFSFVADHFQYLAASAHHFLHQCRSRLVARQQASGLPGPHPGKALVFLVLALLGMQSFSTSVHYANVETLYTWILRHNRDSYLANYNLGSLLLDWQRYQEAIPYLKEAIRLRPETASGYDNLGIAYGSTGKLKDAAEQFSLALQKDPRNKKTWSNLVITSMHMGAYDEALRQIAHYLRLWPKDTLFMVLAGNELRKAGQFALAENLCSEVPTTDSMAELAAQCVRKARKLDAGDEPDNTAGRGS